MGRKPTYPNEENASIEELEVAMEASPTKKGYRRLQAVYMFYQGCDHEQVRKFGNIKRPVAK